MVLESALQVATSYNPAHWQQLWPSLSFSLLPWTLAPPLLWLSASLWEGILDRTNLPQEPADKGDKGIKGQE
jgi:hypothetical protein